MKQPKKYSSFYILAYQFVLVTHCLLFTISTFNIDWGSQSWYDNKFLSKLTNNDNIYIKSLIISRISISFHNHCWLERTRLGYYNYTEIRIGYCMIYICFKVFVEYAVCRVVERHFFSIQFMQHDADLYVPMERLYELQFSALLA